MIKTIFVGVILAVVMGMATSMIVANLPTGVDYSTTLSGTGQENLDVGSYTSVENGTLSVNYDVATSMTLSENLNGNVVISESVTGTGTIENDVTGLITQNVNTLDAGVSGAQENLNSLSSTLDATVNEDTLGVVSTAKSMGPTISASYRRGVSDFHILGPSRPQHCRIDSLFPSGIK